MIQKLKHYWEGLASSRRAKRGAKLLDETWMCLGEGGWAQLIDTDSLDMRSLDRCILGQLYGCYYDGIESYQYFTITRGGPIKLGFALYPGRKNYAEYLRGAWVDEINKRL